MTLSTIITRARYKVRDTDALIYASDDDDAILVSFANDILHEIWADLRRVESNLAYGHGTITLSDGTIEYTPSFSFEGFMDDGVWLDGEDWYLTQVDEADKVLFDYDDTNSESEPEHFYVTEDGNVGFLPVPDTTYTVYCQYWKPLTEFEDTTDTVPFAGIWDQFMIERLAMEMLGVQERDVRFQALKVDMAHDRAMAAVYNRGCRRRRHKGGLFELEGV